MMQDDGWSIARHVSTDHLARDAMWGASEAFYQRPTLPALSRNMFPNYRIRVLLSNDRLLPH